MIIWLTGLSGSGKTTISNILYSKLKTCIPPLVKIDGDEIRELFNDTKTYDENSRYNQIKRIQRLALILSKQGLYVIVSALYCNPELMEWNRKNFKSYYEIYLDIPLDEIIKRDPKGLYEKAKNGKLKNVVGIDIEWHAPKNPDIVLKNIEFPKAEEMANEIINKIDYFKDLYNVEK